MVKRKKSKDENQIAAGIIAQLTEISGDKSGKDPLAVLLGHRGGLKGGKARAASLTAERRKEIATNAVKARWAKRKS